MEKTLEHTNCDFCGGNKAAKFLESEDHVTKEKFIMVKCSTCGLVYLNPRPVKEKIGGYYPGENYYSYQDFTDKKLNYREWLKQASLEGYYNSKNIFKKILSWLLVRNFQIVVPKELKGRLLDIGCGSGEFLNQMKNFGWEVYGVEISPEAADMGNKRGLNVFCGELGSADFPQDYFDVVVLSQSLEHVYSPGAYLEYQIIKSLFDEGYLEYNTGAGLNTYKLNWTDQIRQNVVLHVCNRNLRGEMVYQLENRVIPFLKRIRDRKWRSR